MNTTATLTLAVSATNCSGTTMLARLDGNEIVYALNCQLRGCKRCPTARDELASGHGIHMTIGYALRYARTMRRRPRCEGNWPYIVEQLAAEGILT